MSGGGSEPANGMRIHRLHRWDVRPTEAGRLQRELQKKVSRRWQALPVETVAGIDVSFPSRDRARAAAVFLEYPGLRLLGYTVRESKCTFPYIPGFLAFREAPAVLDLLSSSPIEPDLIICDGQGIAHPRRMGLATHVGLFVDVPTIGCAKSLLCGKYREPGRKRGCRSRLLDPRGEVIGAVLRIRDGVKPVFVSIGNRIDLDHAVGFVLKCSPRYRISEPIRLAHRAAAGEKLKG